MVPYGMADYSRVTEPELDDNVKYPGIYKEGMCEVQEAGEDEWVQQQYRYVEIDGAYSPGPAMD